MFADIAKDQKLPAFLRMHEAAFEYLGGVTSEILYDNTKTVVLRTLTEGVDNRGEVKLNPAFADFARYWGFTPRLCRPYRPQTKGKVESGVRYLRQNFLPGRQADDLTDLRRQLHLWTAQIANVRLHGTTHRLVGDAWHEEKPTLTSAHNRPAFPLVVSAVRRVTRDAFVCWGGNRYSVPWQNAGKEVQVQEVGPQIAIVREKQTLAVHLLASGTHQTVTVALHHQDIPTASPRSGKARLSLGERAPEVEVRSLDVYEALAAVETEVAA
jgi:hypothetical protein